MKFVVIQDKELCGACGGRCCKNSPGLYIPSDFGESEDEIYNNLKPKLNSGEITTRYGSPTPKRTGNYLSFLDPQRCVHLADSGCKLGDRKPSQCKALNPAKKNHYNLEQVARTANALLCYMTKGMEDDDIHQMWKESTAYQLIRMEQGYPV